MAATARLRVEVVGLVQGVGFRFFVRREATRQGLTGTVRNKPSGDCVEVVAEGQPAALRSLLDRLRDGPPGANVHHIEAEWEEATGEFDQFQIRS